MYLWQVELETRSLTIDRKRLYFNLRENSRGRFIKVPVPTHTHINRCSLFALFCSMGLTSHISHSLFRLLKSTATTGPL